MSFRQSNLNFRLMALTFKLRDLLWPRRPILAEAGIAPGNTVLDFGCGPGSYVRGAADLAGPGGKVYALDVHPLALAAVRALVEKHGLGNVEVIAGGAAIPLPDAGVDTVILHDVYHELAEPEAAMREIHRVLKPGGALSFSDHHMKGGEIETELTRDGLFEHAARGARTHRFRKIP